MKRWIPRSYQITASMFMILNRFAGLLLDPGLGKTSISLFVIKCLKRVGKINGVLVIVPIRPLYNAWLGENKKWSQMRNIKISVLHGKNKEKALKTKADVYLINPEGLPWLAVELLRYRKWPFDTLIVDESSKFKNPSSKRLKYLLVPMLKKFRRRYILTGSPIPRGMMDMFSQVFILDRGESLGSSIGAFKSKYFDRYGFKNKELKIKKGAAKKIRKKIQHLMLTMKAEDHISMPDLIFNDLSIQLPKVAFSKYKEMEKELFMELDEYEFRASNAAVKFDVCHQIANGCVYEQQDMLSKPIPSKSRKFHVIHQEKLKALRDLHEELNYKPLLVAYKYHHDLKSILKFFGKIPHIGSGVSVKQCSKIEKDWNAGKIPMLLGQPQSMAHGMNLQEAGTNVAYFNIDSNLDDHEQFFKRVWRSGVEGDKVVVHRFISANTVDELILARLKSKGEDQNSFKDELVKYRNRVGF